MSTNSVNPHQNNPVKKQIKPALLIIDTQNKYLKVIQPRDKELELLKKTGTNTLFLSGLSAVGCVPATMIGAMNHDYQPFIVKDAIMSHNTEYTRNVEAMFDAISFNAVKLILENC
jgi:nicotinamidase-related amidase